MIIDIKEMYRLGNIICIIYLYLYIYFGFYYLSIILAHSILEDKIKYSREKERQVDPST